MRPDAFHSRTTSVISPDDLLAVTEHEDVDVVGQRLGVEGAVAAGGDERVLRTPLLGRAPGTPARSMQFRTLV